MSDDIQLIKDKIDVADLIAEYVQLRPAGANQKGLCPFHHEKTPSFMVNRERQRWHCFGCAKGGDIFSFIQEIEGMEFVEALKFLANRAGVVLTNTRADTNSSQKNRLKDINAQAANFFHNVLTRLPASRAALAYLHTRGLQDHTIEAWGIGFVPEQWDLLTQYLLKKGHSIDDLVASGLTIKRDGADRVSGKGFYDRFRGRIMFPIRDVHGLVVGFTGRVLVETETSGGKYVNTPQTPLYDKSRVVFGLDRAKQEIKAKNLTVMVEGQMDVIASHQAGMTNVVASSGTALTAEQVHLLKRYSSNIAIAFDMDAAGLAAAKRGIDVAMGEGMNIRVIQIPSGAGKDPDECVKKDPAVWFRAVESATDIMAWYVSRAFTGKNVSDPKQKQVIANELLPEIARIPFAVERDHWLREVGGRLGADVPVLREDMVRMRQQSTVNREQRTVRSEQRSVNGEQGTVNREQKRIDVLLERFFALVVRFPTVVTVPRSLFPVSCVIASPFHPLYDALEACYTRGIPMTIDALADVLPSDNEREMLTTLLMRGDLLYPDMDQASAKREMMFLIDEIHKEWRHSRRSVLERQIAEAEKKNDIDVLRGLYQEFKELL